MKIEVSFSVRGDVRRVERSMMRAYILKEIRKRNVALFSEIIRWRGEVFPVAISWKEHETNNGRGASFWVSVIVKEDRDLTSAFRMVLGVKEAIEKGLGEDARKYKEEIEKILREYNGGKRK